MAAPRLIFITNFTEIGRGTFNVARALLGLPSFDVVKFDIAGRQIARGPLRTPLTLLHLLLTVAANRRAMIFADTRRGIDLLDKLLRVIGERPYVLRYGNVYLPPAEGVPERMATSLARRLRRARLVIVPSEAARTALADGLGRPIETIAVAHNGEDRDFADRRSDSADAPVNLLCLGRLEHRKRPELALCCLDALVRGGADARLTFIGGGDQAVLRAEAGRLGIADRVVFAGFRPEPWETVPPNAVLLHPARREGFGYAVLEAIGRGIPAIVVDGVGGPEEIVRITGGGLIVTASGEAMAQAVRALTGNAADLSGRMREARAVVRDYFSVRRMVADYDRLLTATGISG